MLKQIAVILKLATFVTLLTLNGYAFAETITLKLGEQAPELRDEITLPSRGATMEEVVAQYGEPESKSEPRGEPPIESWQYTNFVVYFEHQTAIHAVLKHTPKITN